jgi:hypothetical protein
MICIYSNNGRHPVSLTTQCTSKLPHLSLYTPQSQSAHYPKQQQQVITIMNLAIMQCGTAYGYPLCVYRLWHVWCIRVNGQLPRYCLCNELTTITKYEIMASKHAGRVLNARLLAPGGVAWFRYFSSKCFTSIRWYTSISRSVGLNICFPLQLSKCQSLVFYLITICITAKEINIFLISTGYTIPLLFL